MRSNIRRIGFAVCIIFLSTALFSQGVPKRSATIEWEPVNGAGGYQIELMRGSQILVNQKTQSTSYTIDPAILEPGTYRLRISTLDRNQEVASNSPWIDIHVRERGKKKDKYIYIAAGWGYTILLPEWNELSENSVLNVHLYGGYDLSPKYGIDVVLDVNYFDKRSDKENIFQNLTTYAVLPGFYYMIPLAEHFSFFTRIGAGISVGKMSVINENIASVYYSTDFLLAPSVAIRSSYQNFFADTGLEFHSIFYGSSPFFDLKPFLRIGVKF